MQPACVNNLPYCCTDPLWCAPVHCEPDIQACRTDFDCGYTGCEAKGNGKYESCTLGLGCVNGKCQAVNSVQCQDCSACRPVASSVSSIASSQASSVAPKCGDSKQDSGEQCGEPGLNCPIGQLCNNSTCQCTGQGFCGNGRSDQGEQCGEPGLFCPKGQTCNLNQCLCSGGPLCGDGRKDTNEQCGEPGMFCPKGQTCNLNTCLCSGGPFCGNGAIDDGEQCGEPGLRCNANETCNLNTCLCAVAPASSSSIPPVVVATGSVRNVTNVTNITNITNVRTQTGVLAAVVRPSALCGDGKTDIGEQCGEPGLLCPQGQTCEASWCMCQGRAYCGDGKADKGEQCGEPGLYCGAGQNCDTARCICGGGPRCGDGNVDSGEQCGEPGLACPASENCIGGRCLCGPGPQCGNGRADKGEQCGEPGLTCGTGQVCQPNTCVCVTPPNEVFVCGNAKLDRGEECDDGNVRDLDGCSAVCKLEKGFCGDGTVQQGLGEQCEPSNYKNTPSTVCGADCRIHSFLCGDAKVDEGEECDEGTRNSDLPGGHCRTNCSLARCGDGILDQPAEQCDDGNKVDGDGCSRYCQNQPGAPTPRIPGQVIPQQPQQPQQTLSSVAPSPILPRPVVTPLNPPKQVPLQQTGPEVIAIMAAGAAGGYAWIRKRRR